MLDEVDAPLDDANIDRFCDLLDAMVAETETRYLIVTHNAVTMSRMHRLFGVTMVEQGVSRAGQRRPGRRGRSYWRRSESCAPIALAACIFCAPLLWRKAPTSTGAGWRTDGGAPRVFEFVIAGSKVSGVHCTQLRRRDRTAAAGSRGSLANATASTSPCGTCGADGIAGDGRRNCAASSSGGKLVIADEGVALDHYQGPARARRQAAIPRRSCRRVRRRSTCSPPRAEAAEASARARHPTSSRLHGGKSPPATCSAFWLGFGVGMEKQYFIIRRDGEMLFGLACGRCDNPYTFGALENFKTAGDTLEFDILHGRLG